MAKKQVSSDQVLDKIFELYMDDLAYPPRVEKALDHILSTVGDNAYKEIEDDLSIIMTEYENRAFKVGFRAGSKTIIALSQEDVNK